MQIAATVQSFRGFFVCVKELNCLVSELTEVAFCFVQDSSESLGISIAGGVLSQRGDTPVYVTNINQGGPIGRCRQVKVCQIPSSVVLTLSKVSEL